MSNPITDIHKNVLGTVSFTGHFPGMLKPQDFVVYPLADSGTEVTVQSSTRIGTICLERGVLKLSCSHPRGAFFFHLQIYLLTTITLSAEDTQALRQWVKSTGGLSVGKIVKSDNTGALGL